MKIQEYETYTDYSEIFLSVNLEPPQIKNRIYLINVIYIFFRNKLKIFWKTLLSINFNIKCNQDGTWAHNILPVKFWNEKYALSKPYRHISLGTSKIQSVLQKDTKYWNIKREISKLNYKIKYGTSRKYFQVNK